MPYFVKMKIIIIPLFLLSIPLFLPLKISVRDVQPRLVWISYSFFVHSPRIFASNAFPLFLYLAHLYIDHILFILFHITLAQPSLFPLKNSITLAVICSWFREEIAIERSKLETALQHVRAIMLWLIELLPYLCSQQRHCRFYPYHKSARANAVVIVIVSSFFPFVFVQGFFHLFAFILFVEYYTNSPMRQIWFPLFSSFSRLLAFYDSFLVLFSLSLPPPPLFRVSLSVRFLYEKNRVSKSFVSSVLRARACISYNYRVAFYVWNAK